MPIQLFNSTYKVLESCSVKNYGGDTLYGQDLEVMYSREQSLKSETSKQGSEDARPEEAIFPPYRG